MDIKEYFGRNFNIDREAQKRYQRLKNGHLFLDVDYKNIFMLAMSMAMEKHLPRKTLKNPYPLLNTASFSRGDLWVITAVAVEEEGSLGVLSKPNEMRHIAEEYAMAGLPEVERLEGEFSTTDSLLLHLNELGIEGLKSLKD